MRPAIPPAGGLRFGRLRRLSTLRGRRLDRQRRPQPRREPAQRRLVVDRVTNGAGAMPAFGDQLDEQQIQDVAAYVVDSTQGRTAAIPRAAPGEVSERPKARLEIVRVERRVAGSNPPSPSSRKVGICGSRFRPRQHP